MFRQTYVVTNQSNRIAVTYNMANLSAKQIGWQGPILLTQTNVNSSRDT